jgi:hypothetical protein
MRTLLGALPFGAIGAWTAFFYFKGISSLRCWRWSLALSCTVLGSFVLVLTELLSAVHGLSASWALVAWTLYLLIPLVILFKKRESIDVAGEVLRVVGKLKRAPNWMLGLILLIGGVMLLMAVASPPMNFDVQSYHLPRQIFWLMQGSVRHFDATYPFQNCHPVLTEYLGLNLMLLSGGDAWHNLVQFLFFIAACGLVTLITQAIGGAARAQGLAVLFIALVPVAFFQASNSKNDIVASFFMLMPLLIGLRIWNRTWNPEVTLLMLAALGAGLAMASKGTSAAYLPSIAALILIACLRVGAWRRVLLALIPGIALVTVTILPNSLRNLETYHSLTGPSAGMTNERYDLGSVLGVAIKNIANEYAFGSDASLHGVEIATRKVLGSLGLDADDPYTNLGSVQTGGAKLHFFYFVGCEDIIPAPIQMTLCLLAPCFFLIPVFRKRTGTIALGGVVLGSFFLFCALFRWQPWGGRLLIPFFFMVAPLVGNAGALIVPQWVPLMVTALGVFFLQPHMMFHGQRHLFGWQSVFRLSKQEQMSIAMPGRHEEIRSVMDQLKNNGVRQILVDGHDSPNYGLLRQLRLSFPQVILRSGQAQHPGQADAIVDASATPVVTGSGELKNYQLLWAGKFYSLYLRHP